MSPEELAEILQVCPSAKEMAEGGHRYIHFPALRMPPGRDPTEQEALLCLTSRDGYATRLFLAKVVSGTRFSWTSFNILDRQWHTWSWKDVPPSLRPIEILAQHLKALR